MCAEDASMFTPTLSYGSETCTGGQNSPETGNFNSSGVATFVLDVSNFDGNVCILAETIYEDQQEPLCRAMERLVFLPCLVDEIRSVADSSVIVKLSSPESLEGMVHHGTVATFVSSSVARTFKGNSQSTCRNGQWNDLSSRSTERKCVCSVNWM